MAVRPPGDNELRAIAEQYRLGLSDERRSAFLEMIGNTAPFDVTGHPATSVPVGLVDGLPAGRMIVGRHFDDATCLRVANALEQAVGGFPTPPSMHGEGGS